MIFTLDFQIYTDDKIFTIQWLTVITIITIILSLFERIIIIFKFIRIKKISVFYFK